MDLLLSYGGCTCSSSTEDDLDICLEVNEVNNDSLYVPTPERSSEKLNPMVIPEKMFVVSLKQLNVFVETINSVCCCITPGCNGILVPCRYKVRG